MNAYIRGVKLVTVPGPPPGKFHLKRAEPM